MIKEINKNQLKELLKEQNRGANFLPLARNIDAKLSEIADKIMEFATKLKNVDNVREYQSLLQKIATYANSWNHQLFEPETH